MGGVLLDLDMPGCIRKFHELGFNDVETMLDSCHQRGFFKEMEIGDIDAREFCQKCISKSNPGTTPDDIVSCFKTFITGIAEEKADLIKRLNKHYDLYILSNNNPVSMSVCTPMFDKLGIPLSIFKKVFISYQMRILKPSPEIFQTALKEITADPAEILFIDDSSANTAAAEELGMNALLYRVGTNLSEAVESRLKVLGS